MLDVKPTQFRKRMFEILDLAAHGEPVEITYKGAKLTLSAQPNGSKLARAVRRNALQVDPQSIVESDGGLMGELQAAWSKSDKEL
jgi:antitoxin (DNA-binding transcriptional repressor) of toxin-antitoxin stability system